MNWLELTEVLESPGKGEPLYARIVKYMSDAIDAGVLKSGERLPTNRELAASLQVDRSTISRAYAELAQAGLIDSHVGRGTFVLGQEQPERHTKVATERGTVEWSEKFSLASRTVSEVIAKQPAPTQPSHNTISFGGGLPTEEFYPSSELQKIVSDILLSADAKNLFEYSPAEGLPALRTEVLRHLRDQGIEASDDELLIVSGSQQAIDLVTNVLIDPGDAVLLEDPSYFWAICNLRSHQARCVPVPVDNDGLDLEALERELTRTQAKLIYVMPSFQNPTGAALSLERRVKLIDIARKYGVPILEDNFVGDLRYDDQPLPPLRSLPGGKEVVIHQGTFSKALCPGLRLGWIIAPREVLNRLLMAKRVSDLSTNSMAQLTLARYLSAGLYTQHLERVRAAYKTRRDAMLNALARLFQPTNPTWDVTWNKPYGGLFIWMKLPLGMSARELLRFAELEGVTFSPGDLFFLSGNRREFLRLCFIQTDEASIENGIQRLHVAYTKYLQTVRQTSALSRDSFARTRDQVLI